MRVKIGGYINYLGPYQIAEIIMFWTNKHKDDRVHKFGTLLANDKNGNDSILMKVCSWIQSKRSRTIKVHIDNFDAWNAHNTASLILYPLFEKLKTMKHGSGMVDDEDVPEHLRSINGIKDPDSHTDSLVHERWSWVLDEIIFAVKSDNEEWEDKFWIVHPELDLTEKPEDEGKTALPLRWKVEGQCDWEARQKYQERINNGFRLMGKYWQNLWD